MLVPLLVLIGCGAPGTDTGRNHTNWVGSAVDTAQVTPDFCPPEWVVDEQRLCAEATRPELLEPYYGGVNLQEDLPVIGTPGLVAYERVGDVPTCLEAGVPQDQRIELGNGQDRLIVGWAVQGENRIAEALATLEAGQQVGLRLVWSGMRGTLVIADDEGPLVAVDTGNLDPLSGLSVEDLAYGCPVEAPDERVFDTVRLEVRTDIDRVALFPRERAVLEHPGRKLEVAVGAAYVLANDDYGSRRSYAAWPASE